MESSGQAESKTVPEFAFLATFEGDIVGFTLVKVLVATTVYAVTTKNIKSILKEEIKNPNSFLAWNLQKE